MKVNKINDKNGVLFFYGLVTVVAIILSTWIMAVSTYKNKEIEILQHQIDSLIYTTNKLHIEIENNQLILQENLPSNKIQENYGLKNIIITHSTIFFILLIIIFLYFKCVKRFEPENEETNC